MQTLHDNTVSSAVSDIDIDAASSELKNTAPKEILDRALDLFGDQVAISFSGAEDVLLVELAHQLGRPFRVFTLDTGRLHPETYRLFAQVEQRYGLQIEYLFPETNAVQQLVRTKGLFSFFADGHRECCSIRKVEPLRRQLSTLRAWITGQRQDQSPGTRDALAPVQWDTAFKGRNEGPLVKWNPLARLSSAEVWHQLRTLDVPFNALHERGYVSIGCEPCTRAVLPGQHERAGRWWWEESGDKECGLHAMNATTTTASPAGP